VRAVSDAAPGFPSVSEIGSYLFESNMRVGSDSAQQIAHGSLYIPGSRLPHCAGGEKPGFCRLAYEQFPNLTLSDPEVSLTDSKGYFRLLICVDLGTAGADIRLAQPDCLTGSNVWHLAIQVG
jgi:hypothetical protein